jgi:hypothetical protein
MAGFDGPAEAGEARTQGMNRIICIQTFSGSRVYVRTSEEKWRELTDGVDVWAGYMVIGWRLDQDKVSAILQQAYHERGDYEIVAISPWRPYHKQLGLECTADYPTPDYYIVYSSIDKPEAT